jgi:hypothetical protein
VPARQLPGIGAPRVNDVEAGVRAKVVELASACADRTPEMLTKRTRQAQAAADAACLRVEEQHLGDSLGRSASLLARGVLDEVAYQAGVRDLRAGSRPSRPSWRGRGADPHVRAS